MKNLRKTLTRVLLSFLVMALLGTTLVNSSQVLAFSGSTNSSTRFNSVIQLTNGRLQLSYKSDTDELTIEYSKSDGSEKEYQLRLSSEDNLGLLIISAEGNISYSIYLLEDENTWDPFSDGSIEENDYRKKATFIKKPGLQIIVVEKIESIRFTKTCRGSPRACPGEESAGLPPALK